jgi:hypothetical protein
MPDSPIAATPYEVLGVAPSVTDDELRRAYRRMLRSTHPDVGGDPARFLAVQAAWERVGTTADRQAYDRGRGTGRGTGGAESSSWATPSSTAPRADTRPKTRAYGHPGGWRRERYLTLIREWAGRGADLADPYDPALVASAPRHLRRILADALAEEATARTLSTLGIGYTVWHDVSTGPPEEKIDHVVLGPTGLFAMLSEDYGDVVRVRGGDLIGDAIAGERPMHDLGQRAKRLGRSTRVRFTALVIVLPDDALPETVVPLGRSRGAAEVAVRQSFLPGLLRNGIDGAAPIGGTELFDLRTRLQAGIRFVSPDPV